MKLTKKIKSDFVEAVLADVPSNNYATKAEDLLRKNYFALLKKLKLDGIDNQRLSHNRASVECYCHRDKGEFFAKPDPSTKRWGYNTHTLAVIAAPGLSDEEVNSIKNTPEMLKLVQGHVDEMILIKTLRSKLEATIASCSTLKQAKECLPEFEKYLPAEVTPADRSLPVVGNLVAELTKAGWPKKKK